MSSYSRGRPGSLLESSSSGRSHSPSPVRKTWPHPEIKMTRAQELRQKPMQSSRKLQVKPGLPGDEGLIVRNSLSSLGSQESFHISRYSTSNTSISSLGRESSSYKAPQSPKGEPGKSVIDRLYKAPEVKHDFLRKSNRGLPEGNYRRMNSGDKNYSRTVRRKVYDWVNRKVKSQDDVRDETKYSRARTHRTRRNSYPLGADNSVHALSDEVENGYKEHGPRFIQFYFQKGWRWLGPRVDRFLTWITVGPKLPAATNEERYIWEERETIAQPYDPEESYVDMLDMLCGEVTMDKFSEFVHVYDGDDVPKPVIPKKEPEEVPKPVVPKIEPEVPKPLMDHVAVQTERVKFDAWTNTYKPIMVNKLVGAGAKKNMSTSTSDLSKHVKARTAVGTTTADLRDLANPRGIPAIRVDAGTSTSDLCDDWSDSTLTPRASPVSVVQDDVSPANYDSLYSENLRRSLIDKVNNYYKEITISNLHGNKWADRRRSSKAVMTDDETMEIHTELNKLASERIEIIELLALHIPNLPSCLTVELLEAKLNYSIGQTDQLLALLEDSWELEARLPNSTRSKELVNITQEIILQSRVELEESKKAIKLCLDEVRHIQAGGHSRNRFLNREIMKMKRRAEIEAFKLERMWEQLFYERSKKEERFLRSVYSGYERSPSVSSTDSAVDAMEKYVHFLTDLRKRSALAASEDELNDLRMRSPLSQHDINDYHNRSWDTYSLASTSSQASQHRDYIAELKRQMALDKERDFPSSRSRSESHCNCSFSSTNSRLSSSSHVDSGLGQSSSSYAAQPQYSSSWSKRYIGPGSLYTASSKSTTYRSSSQQPSSLYMSQVDHLSPTRPSYRSAGRYSVK
ncbi:uncharacterized protein LOC124280078 [Haliotis rubra]|uniref:uncharacterized protein LOC124255485 n=1 Tax=Haliotis rubra TaxID=36100 RepID=UPI001EE5AB1A|nr:uncharacterized protein LOC124255485 [Haliotis rubra]XP_046545365.1 uncharacterized protein LOC124255485 [Haliotis rubra]XP_046571911.1 uncharacterized protein LOC124280078 [Haliotis rubra]XP_046571912.1 uncharacterized protein LOC124280078 [Haliotis rubra]